MANTKISALTALTNPTGNEELVYAYNNANGKMTLDTMKTYSNTGQQAALVSGVNIKTINNESILGSGNIDVSGGGGGGGFEPTELGGDANIWELSAGAYTTEYDLYYKTGESVPAVSSGTGRTKKQMLFVTEDGSGVRGFFVFNAGKYGSTSYLERSGFGYSVSASTGDFNMLKQWDASLKQYDYSIGTGFSHPDSISNYTLTQILDNIDDGGTNDLRISISNPPYPGVTYTIYVNSVKTGETYSFILGSGVTNPLNIALPTNSNKRCVITVLVTSPTSGIVTGCTMEN